MTIQNAQRAWSDALKKHVRKGQAYHLEIRHDEDCMIYSPARVCSCNPDRVLLDVDGNTLAMVEGAGSYDPLELMGARR